MKYATPMKYWLQDKPPTLMEALVRKHYLLSKGFQEVGVSSVHQTSSDFNTNLMKRLPEAEEVAMVPFFELGNSLFLGEAEKIVPGTYRFFAIFPEEEEEKIPDTLPGGFRVDSQHYENPASPFRKIKRKSPSELLYELSYEQLGVLYENVERFYFEPHQREEKEHQFPHNLSIDDVIILSRMEKEKKLDLVELKNKHSSAEDRKLGKRLEDIRLSPLLIQIERSVYALSPQALDGMYVAVVHKRYLPKGFQD